MKYSVEKIENNKIILENINNKKIIEIKNKNPNIKEGSILEINNNKIRIDIKEEINRRNKIKNKFDKLKK